MNATQLEILIDSQIKKHQADNNDRSAHDRFSYCGSSEDLQTEETILDGYMEVFGYDFEADEDLMEFGMKATPLEIWEYHRDIVLPKLKENQ